ncbi:MAG TPA: SDR family NAD(P)-dependent oxidoreductase [Solirubrobacteraceae bacterium]
MDGTQTADEQAVGRGQLAGRVALVTGAAGAGIGHAVARRFALEGAEVVLTDAHARRAGEVAEGLAGEVGREIVGLELDVRDQEQVDAAVRTALDRHGRIDVLFNNAGINQLRPLWEIDDATWDLVLGVCLQGTFRCMRAVLPGMLERGSGAIVNMASVAGYLGSSMGEAAYCAAKAGVMGLTRAAAAECGPRGVRVNAIAPGVIMNPFLARIYPEGSLEAMQEQTSVKRLGAPEDVAKLALFLASDESAYITGEVHTISGGLYMHA